jgi:hypothetical protein
MATVELDPAELECLVGKYREAGGLVNYKQFIDNMDKIFTQNDIDKDPLFNVKQIDRETTLPARREYKVNIFLIFSHFIIFFKFTFLIICDPHNNL